MNISAFLFVCLFVCLFLFVCARVNFWLCYHRYRKVVGDRCKDGLEDKLMPETRPCPIRGTCCFTRFFFSLSQCGLH